MDAGGSSSIEKNMESVEVNSDTVEIIPGFPTFEAFTQAAFKSLMEATRNSNNLPTNENWDYYSSFPSFPRIMNAEGARVLELIKTILQHQGMKGNIVRREFEEKFDLIVDANDSILERVSCNLDELSGIRKDPQLRLMQTSLTAPVSGSWNVNRTANFSRKTRVAAPIRLFAAENIQRPQIKFKDKVDNSSAPFEPRIKDKPNSLKPLSILLEMNDEGDESFSHPYEYELNRFKPPSDQLKQVKPCMFKPIDDTPLIYVEREDQLAPLVNDLANYSEIAVDLEHHSYRTFQGITCLMQISTRDTDYIIDTLDLRDKLHCLNEIFTKPSIVKVFHGADHDIEWLQRDLCLYVVNMFDTHQAAKLLNFPQLSLAFLLKHYCRVLADKHFQLADWRIRPLPEELITYARDDTHYLLYIYDMMKNALLDAANGQDNLLSSLFQISTELCKKRYEKPRLREDSHMILYRRNRKLFDNRQLYALKELYKWRDKIARDEDESIGYVLPNHMMLQIAETLPREMQGILACCNPIPPIVRQNLLALHYIILRAREQPLVKPITEETPKVRTSTHTWSKVNLDGPLHCPHDLTHQHDFRDDLPTLIRGTLKNNRSPKKSMEKLKGKPIISIFEVETSDKDNDHLKHVAFICPYERYKRVKPFIQAQEAEKIEEESVENGEEHDNENNVRIKRIKDHFVEVSFRLEKQEKPREEKEDSKNEKKNNSDEEYEATTRSQITTSMKPAETMDDLHPLRSKKRNRKANRSNRKKAKNNVEESVSQSTKRKNVDESLMDESETHSTKRPTLDGDNSNQLVSTVPKNKKKKMPEEGFVTFDYSKINYSRFQGGSKSNQTNSNVEGKFKPKGKKGKRGKNNKSMTFGKGK